MESFEQRMRVESDCYEDGRNGTVLFVHFEDALKIAREADAALAAKDAEIVRLQPRKIAPVQGYYPGIPWDMHLRAYAAYCKKWSPQKALIEGNCRGGFGTDELDEFIPGWLDELSERTRLTAINTAKGELIAKLTEYFDSDYNKVPEDIAALRARIRSLENE